MIISNRRRGRTYADSIANNTIDLEEVLKKARIDIAEVDEKVKNDERQRFIKMKTIPYKKVKKTKLKNLEAHISKRSFILPIKELFVSNTQKLQISEGKNKKSCRLGVCLVGLGE